MRRLSKLAILLCALVAVAGCQSGSADLPPTATGANAVIGDPIEVTALGAPADAAAPEPTLVEPAGDDTAPLQAAPDAETAAPSAEAAEPAPVPAPAPDAEAEAEPVAPKSDKQLACEKKKGHWMRVGKGSARSCVFPTKDAGKRCERESQCDGVCLARSGTCAPFKPLFGCNEILQDNGMRVTLCLD